MVLKLFLNAKMVLDHASSVKLPKMCLNLHFNLFSSIMICTLYRYYCRMMYYSDTVPVYSYGDYFARRLHVDVCVFLHSVLETSPSQLNTFRKALC